MSSFEDRKTIETALTAMAGRCDYADRLDGQGFNKFDAKFGHDLAEQVINGLDLSDRQLLFALKMLQKYRQQLATINIMLPGDTDKAIEQLQKTVVKKASSLLDRALLFGDKRQWTTAETKVIWRGKYGRFAFLKVGGNEIRLHITGIEKTLVIYEFGLDGWQPANNLKSNYIKWTKQIKPSIEAQDGINKRRYK